MSDSVIRRIMVPIDASACSEAAADYAAELAHAIQASVTLVHAWHPVYELGPMLGGALIATDGGHRSLTEHIRAEAEATLAAQADRLVARGVIASRRLIEGVPKRAIVEEADAGDYDLIVMGTHGRTGLAHALMGSVAEWVVAHTSVPVLTVRAPRTDTERPTDRTQP